MKSHTEYMAGWRKKNREKCLESTRRWMINNKEKIKELKKKYNKKYRENNRQKIRAERFSQRNRKSLLDDVCSFCEVTKKLQLHHPDYSKPELVITLCFICHMEVHRKY